MNPVIAAIANEMCRAVSMGAGTCGLTRWNAGHLPNDEVMRCAMLKCHHTSRRTAKWGELLTLQSSEGDDQLDYDSSWKINEACLRFDSQNGLEVTFQKRCADVQLLLAISSQLPSTLKRITLPNFPTNFPTFQLWTFFEVIDKKTMFLLLKQVQPTLNEVPRASTGCHASHDSRRFRQNQAEFEARFRRLDGDSSGKVRSLGMKIGFFQKRKTWYVHRINKKQMWCLVIFLMLAEIEFDEFVKWCQHSDTLSDNMWLSAFWSDIVWLVPVPPRVYDDEAESKNKNNYRCLQWKSGGWPPCRWKLLVAPRRWNGPLRTATLLE